MRFSISVRHSRSLARARLMGTPGPVLNRSSHATPYVRLYSSRTSSGIRFRATKPPLAVGFRVVAISGMCSVFCTAFVLFSQFGQLLIEKHRGFLWLVRTARVELARPLRVSGF